jgi:hypothetical protein
MSVEIITKDDLESFRLQLLQDFKGLLNTAPAQQTKNWLRGSEVRKMLMISPGTLQNLRISGKLKSSKVGSIHYYRYADIEVLLDQKS